MQIIVSLRNEAKWLRREQKEITKVQQNVWRYDKHGIVLKVEMVSWMHVWTRTYQIVCDKHIKFILVQLYLNKGIFLR